jgi:hypothetical protein
VSTEVALILASTASAQTPLFQVFEREIPRSAFVPIDVRGDFGGDVDLLDVDGTDDDRRPRDSPCST